MEFGWSEAEVEYRRQLRAFLEGELTPEYWTEPSYHGVKREGKQKTVEFNAKLAARGWLTPHWPKQYGGLEATAWQHVILGEEMWSIGEPRGPQYMNVNWIGPAIMLAGTEEQKAYHLTRISKGDVFWCQGFSEPDSGSDLASLKTSAVRDGDEYVVNGQKIWTSHCQVADFCFLLVRTDPAAPKNKGISILLVPVDTPGFEMRPIPDIVHEGAFHELFFTDMRVPVSARLGPENEGWDIVRRALQYERVGSPRWERAQLILDWLANWTKKHGSFDDPEIRRRLGEAQSIVDSARLLAYSVIDERAHGKVQSAIAYVSRAAMVRAERHVGDLTMEIVGIDGLELGSVADDAYRNAMTAGVAAGAYEIQLNLIAGMVLRLPR